MGVHQAVEKQVHAKQLFWQSPKTKVLGQHTTAATTHLKDGKSRQTCQSRLHKRLQNGTLAKLHGKEVGCIEQGIQIAASETAFAVLVFPSEACNIIQWVFPLSAQERRLCYRSNGSRI